MIVILFEKIYRFIYLGSYVATNVIIEKDIRKGEENEAWGALQCVNCCRGLGSRPKRCICVKELLYQEQCGLEQKHLMRLAERRV